MRTLTWLLLTGFACAGLSAQSADVPLHNWTVPPYTRSSGGITTMTDVTAPRAFIGVQPCRIADTRGNGAPIQGGIFPNSGLRTWDVTGICGLPAGTDAISVNFTVVSPAGTPQGAFLLAWPTTQPPPPTAIMTYGPGVTILSNAAIVPLSSGDQMNVNVSHSTHIVMDVNGYFSDVQQGSGIFVLTTSAGNAVNVESTSGVGVFGRGLVAGVVGQATGTGVTPSGVSGLSFALSGITFGGSFQAQSASSDSAGVLGSAGGRPTNTSTIPRAGVRGESPNYGVVGISPLVSSSGVLLNGAGAVVAEGILGFAAVANYGVWGFGGFGGTGAKYFVEPHPTDPSKVIRYISLEGNEPGTYFRGRGKFERGLARIPVPEDFRMVTDEEGLTVQVTPIGPMATFSVLRADLNEIVVQCSRNVDFYYMVNGVRRTHKQLTSPIGEGREYMPRSESARMPDYLTSGQKQLLIQNGTYEPDGTVNMETARRLGWDREWAKRARPAPQPAE